MCVAVFCCLLLFTEKRQRHEAAVTAQGVKKKVNQITYLSM